jgi:hypothetical protein
VSSGAVPRFAAALLADFFAGLLDDFPAAFFATAFFAAFLAVFPTAFFAFRAFFTTRLLLAARFFVVAFLVTLARRDLRTIFAFRFFDAFFFGVATTNSFMT